MHSPTTEPQIEKINFDKVTKQGFLLNAANHSLPNEERYVHTKSRITNTIFCQNNDNIRIHLRLVSRFRVCVKYTSTPSICLHGMNRENFAFLQSFKDVRNMSLLFSLINSAILFVRVTGIMIDVDIKKQTEGTRSL
jgi:hypothetical protein